MVSSGALSAVVTGDLPTASGLVVPAAALTWRFSRATGPGGQGVNTTDSRVELVVDLGALIGDSDTAERVRSALGATIRIVVTTERSQLRNREIALQRLASRIDAAATPRQQRRATRPTHGSVVRRLEAKQERSQLKTGRRPTPPDES